MAGVCLRLASAIEKEDWKPQYLWDCSCRPKSLTFWANVPYWREVSAVVADLRKMGPPGLEPGTNRL
jgi:hypothetical protein